MKSLRPGLVILLVACLPLAIAGSCKEDPKETGPTGDTHDTIDTEPPGTDGDGDGVTVNDGDCDDANADVRPGRTEDCNGLDDNCNGVKDEGFGDQDGDGTSDCMDLEECDRLDNDGDGLVDEDFADSDGDGIADCAGTEVCDGLDNDSDGNIDEGYDADSDGFTQCGTAVLDGDCNDADARVYPGAPEDRDDAVDNDCDELVDEGLWAAGDLVVVEIMANPAAVADSDGEWFEVWNASGRDLYLNGLEIFSGTAESFQLVADELLIVPAEGSFVLGVNADDDANGGAKVDAVYADVILGNESDWLTLVADGVTLDEVTWDDGVTMPDRAGSSMSLDPWSYDATTNDQPDAWCASTLAWGISTDFGSPGGENEPCSTWDHDGDGYITDDGDCDDTNPRIYPGAPELDPGVDNDCDGIINVMPTAVATYDDTLSNLLTCSPLYLDGSGSYDYDGSPLTYAWTLDAAPTGSMRTTSDIISTTDMSPTFSPDLPGDYTFSLVVNDGDDASFASTFTVAVSSRPYNNSPIADAGTDQSTSSNVSCRSVSYGTAWECNDCSDWSFTASAAGSYDPDGDPLIYAWTVVSGTATLSDSSSATPTVTIDGPSCSYGATNTTVTVLSVLVVDCMGESSTASVTYTYSCTGT